jgi:Protein of unknown function (DUF3108)
MKLLVNGLLMMMMLASFSGEKRKDFIPIKNTSFGTGEVLDYRVNFGFFTVGKASTIVEKKIFNINSRPSYKVDAYGETLGFVSWITKVKDQWGAYVDTAALVTHVSENQRR